MRTRFVGFLLLVAVGVAAIVGVLIWRGSGPLPDPEGCAVEVDGHRFTMSLEQAENASLIAALSVRRGLPARAASIALATAYQESKIVNLDHGDRDSLGLFQQRPSQGWGTAEQVRDPVYATNAFYDALVKIEGYQQLRITEAAQLVQRSGYPEAYEDHAADGRALASALTGNTVGGAFSCVVRHDEGTTADPAAVRRSLRSAYGPLRIQRDDAELTVHSGEPRRTWSIAQYAVAHADRWDITSVSADGLRWEAGDASEEAWSAKETGTETGTGDGVVRIGLS